MKKSIKCIAAALLAAAILLSFVTPLSAAARKEVRAEEALTADPNEEVNIVVKLEDAPALAYYPAGDIRAVDIDVVLSETELCAEQRYQAGLFAITASFPGACPVW